MKEGVERLGYPVIACQPMSSGTRCRTDVGVAYDSFSA